MRQIRRNSPPIAQRDVLLNLDVRQTGLGGASVGPAPMEKYRFDTSALVVYDREQGRPVMLNRHKNGDVRKVAVNFGITF